MKRDIKPPYHYYPWPDPIPAYPSISVSDAVSALLNPEWTMRVIRERTIEDLRPVFDGVVTRNPDYKDFYQMVLQDVVVREADLRDLELPVNLIFQGVYFLDNVVLNNAKISALTIAGNYIGGVLNVVDVRGHPSIFLGNLQVDDVRVYGGELSGFGIRAGRIGGLSIADCKMKGDVSLFDGTEIRDVVMLESLNIERTVEFSSCRLDQVLRITGVRADRIGLVDCELGREVGTDKCSARIVDIHGSRFNASLDLKGIRFQELDAGHISGEGHVLLREDQLRRETSRGRSWFRSKYDIPSKVLGDDQDNEAGLVRAQEQLFALRENFHRMPSMAAQEDYCAYRLMEASRRLKEKGLARMFLWVNKWILGYMILTGRIVAAVTLTITIAGAFYWLLVFTGLGGLSEGSEGRLFQEGVWSGLAKCLYFSVITFTTVGYGDIQPVGAARLVAMIEAALGVFLMPLFAVSVARRALRW